MEVHRRELLVSRICSGTIRVRAGRDRAYLVKRASREQVYAAAELYSEILCESELEGLYDDDDLLAFLLDNGLWDEERQKLLKGLPKEIEEFKVQLYKSGFKSNEKQVIRKALGVAKARFAELSEERGAYHHLSCSGAAGVARARYLVGCALCTSLGQRVFGDDDFWESESGLLDEVLAYLARCRIDEQEMRELARTDPWRQTWNCRNAEVGIFGGPAADYTDEQKTLVNWALLYDNIYQHPECPPEEVLSDDDLLDGWMIEQRRTREKALATKSGDELVTNDKIRNSQEVFLVAETIEDARKVIELNDEFAKAAQRRRFRHLKEKGEVSEQDMPDSRQKIRMEMVKMTAASTKGQ